MPTAGRKPKPQGQAVTRHPLTHDFVEVPDTPYAGRDMPQRFGAKSWPPEARDFWKAWSTMPHCRLWTKSDWAFARATLEVAARFIESGDPRHAAELRNREKVMGTTFDYRRDIRVRYTNPAPEAGTQVTQLDDYRAL